ncbi:MAG: LysM domain-containing protein [Novosphingobium sp.]|nr:LysM domain-containing protein [Novosphingobium sp.]
MKRIAAALALLAAAPLCAQGTSRPPIVAWSYTVQAGDTFSDIARRWGVDMAALGEASQRHPQPLCDPHRPGAEAP